MQYFVCKTEAKKRVFQQSVNTSYITTKKEKNQAVQKAMKNSTDIHRKQM